MEKGNKTGKGWFRPGQSGNPSGRSKKDIELSEVAREHAKEAIDTLINIMRESTKGSERLQAALAILDRGYGKPPQNLEHSHNTGGGVIQPCLIITETKNPIT